MSLEETFFRYAPSDLSSDTITVTMDDSGIFDLEPHLFPQATDLHVAATYFSPMLCKRILNDNGDNRNLETTDELGRTPLAVSLWNGKSADVSIELLEAGATLNVPLPGHPHCKTVQQYLEDVACPLEFSKSLVAAKVATDHYAPYNVLHHAATTGDVDLLQSCFKYNINIDHTLTYLGVTALHEAVLGNHLACVQVLLSRGASISLYDISGSAPFHYICRYNYLDIACWMVEQSDPTVVRDVLAHQDGSGRTPLHWSMEYHHWEMAQYLLSLVPDFPMAVADRSGVFLLKHLFLAYQSSRVSLSCLISISSYLPEDFLSHLLLSTVQEGSLADIASLLDLGASIDCFDVSLNHNSLLLACRLGCTEVVDLLLKRGASLQVKDTIFQSPLHIAARMGWKEIVARLLQVEGCPLNEISKEDRTAFECALQYKHLPVIALFLRHYSHYPISRQHVVFDLVFDWADHRLLDDLYTLLGEPLLPDLLYKTVSEERKRKKNVKIRTYFPKHVTTLSFLGDCKSSYSQPSNASNEIRVRNLKLNVNYQYRPRRQNVILHKAVVAGKREFVSWVFSKLTKVKQQKDLLKSKCFEDETLACTIFKMELQESIRCHINSDLFKEVEQNALKQLHPPSKDEEMNTVRFRRTWSMRVHTDTKTTYERADDIIRKKRLGLRMRLTDSDFTLLHHSLYHGRHLQQNDTEMLGNIIIERVKLLGTRTFPVTCRCSCFKRAVNLHPVVHFVCMCYTRGVPSKAFMQVLTNITRHSYKNRTLFWEDMVETRDSLLEWWSVFSGMVAEETTDLFEGVCQFGGTEQARHLIAYLPEEYQGWRDCLNYSVKRKMVDLVSLLLDHLPEDLPPESGDSAVVLCCQRDTHMCVCKMILKWLWLSGFLHINIWLDKCILLSPSLALSYREYTGKALAPCLNVQQRKS